MPRNSRAPELLKRTTAPPEEPGEIGAMWLKYKPLLTPTKAGATSDATTPGVMLLFRSGYPTAYKQSPITTGSAENAIGSTESGKGFGASRSARSIKGSTPSTCTFCENSSPSKCTHTWRAEPTTCAFVKMRTVPFTFRTNSPEPLVADSCGSSGFPTAYNFTDRKCVSFSTAAPPVRHSLGASSAYAKRGSATNRPIAATIESILFMAFLLISFIPFYLRL